MVVAAFVVVAAGAAVDDDEACAAAPEPDVEPTTLPWLSTAATAAKLVLIPKTALNASA